MSENPHLRFRERLLAREPLFGAMLKTPGPQATEILATVGFDFVAIDQEHSPFDRASIDVILLAGRAASLPVLVRVSGPEHLLAACDGGATGAIVPHVKDAEYARRVAGACRYRGGTRGFATSTRAGGYSSVGMAQHIRDSDAAMTVIGQIEDPGAVENVDAIAGVLGMDALFIGRNDLACSYGEDSVGSAPVQRAVERIAGSARQAGKALGVFISRTDEIRHLSDLGASLFILASDHGFLRAGATRALGDARDAL